MARVPTFRSFKDYIAIEAYNTLTGDGPTAADSNSMGATYELVPGAVAGAIDLPLSRFDIVVPLGSNVTINLASLPVNGVAGVNTTQTVVRHITMRNTHATLGAAVGNAAANAFTGFYTPGTAITTLEAGETFKKRWNAGHAIAANGNIFLANAGGTDITVECLIAVATA